MTGIRECKDVKTKMENKQLARWKGWKNVYILA